MIAYFDASALVKLFLDEPQSDIAREVWGSDVLVATTRIAQTELACAIEAAVRNHRLPREHVHAGVVDGTFLWDRADVLEADSVVVDTAALVGMRHGLRGVDAVHLASALELFELEPLFVTWDREQRRAARAEGLPVYP